MYRQKRSELRMATAKCPECESSTLLYVGSKVTCKNCGHILAAPRKRNKYGAVRTVAKDGIKRDSKFEADIADQLLLRKTAGDIKGYDNQFMVEVWCYREDGEKAFQVRHKVDFRIHHHDGSYELYEAKGVETEDYKWRRKFLENIWLPMHPDHIYTVVKRRG